MQQPPGFPHNILFNCGLESSFWIIEWVYIEDSTIQMIYIYVEIRTSRANLWLCYLINTVFFKPWYIFFTADSAVLSCLALFVLNFNVYTKYTGVDVVLYMMIQSFALDCVCISISHGPIRCLIPRFRKVLKPQNSMHKCINLFVAWHSPAQHCCKVTDQTPDLLDITQTNRIIPRFMVSVRVTHRLFWCLEPCEIERYFKYFPIFPPILLQDYSLTMYLRQAWTDSRLRFDPQDSRAAHGIKLEDRVLDKLWIPDTFLTNEKKAAFHSMTTPNRLLRLWNDGRVLYVSN